MANKTTEYKDELIICALLQNTSIKAAAKECGVCETQIHKRLKQEAFRKKYADARKELVKQSTAYVQGLMGEALKKMVAIMNDQDASHQVQLNAAESIIRTAIKLTEQIDIVEQLEELNKVVFNDEC